MGNDGIKVFDYINIGKKMNHALQQHDDGYAACHEQPFGTGPADVAETGGQKQAKDPYGGKV